LLRALPATFPRFARYYARLVARAAGLTRFRLARRAAMIDRLREAGPLTAVAGAVNAVLLQPQGLIDALVLPDAGAAPFVDAGLFEACGDLYRSDWAVR